MVENAISFFNKLNFSDHCYQILIHEEFKRIGLLKMIVNAIIVRST